MAGPDPAGSNVGPVPGDDVAFLEKFLTAAGFYKPPLTLKGALIEWQKSVELEPTGLLDEATRGKLGDVLAFVSAQSQPDEDEQAGSEPTTAGATESQPAAVPSPSPAPAAPDAGGAPNPDGKFGIPGGAQIWKNEGDGYWYAIYTVPGSQPPVPLAWRIESNDDVAAIFGPGNEWKLDRTLTAEQWRAEGVLSFGPSRQLANLSEHPFDAFTANFNTEANIRPWLRDPEILALTTRAILEGREVTDAELAGTNWWRTHTEAERSWIGEYAKDPKTAQQKIQDGWDNVRKTMIQLGVSNPPEQLVQLIANRVTAGTWSQAYAQNQISKLADPFAPGTMDPTLSLWVNDLAKGGVKLNTLAENTGKVDELVKRWLGPAYAKSISKDQMMVWAGRLRNDPQAEEEIVAELKRKRLSLFPEYENENLSYEDIASTWRGVVTQMWGQAPDETDPLFQQIVRMNDLSSAQELLRREGLQRNVGTVVDQSLSDLGAVFGSGVRRAM